MKVGVIGVGGHGTSRHLTQYKALQGSGEDLEVVAVADSNGARAEAVARRFDVPRFYSSHQQMLDSEELDAVSVVTPTGLHARIAADVLRRGVAVLVDKPMASSLEEAVTVAQAAHDSRAVLMVGYWSRFSPALRYAVGLREEGFYGKIFFSQASMLRRRGIPGIPTFIDPVLSGGKGALLDIGCYAIDALLAIAGFPTPVRVSGRAYTVFGNQQDESRMGWGSWEASSFSLDDYAAGYVSFEDGSSAFLEASWASNLPFQGENLLIRVQGDAGGVEGRGDEAVRHITLSSKLKGVVTDTQPSLGRVDEATEMIRSFVRAVRTGVPEVTADQSLKLHAIIDGVYESSKSKKEVEVVVPEI